eukprot:5472972-Prymnesium_polylepis.1
MSTACTVLHGSCSSSASPSVPAPSAAVCCESSSAPLEGGVSSPGVEARGDEARGDEARGDCVAATFLLGLVSVGQASTTGRPSSNVRGVATQRPSPWTALSKACRRCR